LWNGGFFSFDAFCLCGTPSPFGQFFHRSLKGITFFFSFGSLPLFSLFFPEARDFTEKINFSLYGKDFFFDVLQKKAGGNPLISLGQLAPSSSGKTPWGTSLFFPFSQTG